MLKTKLTATLTTTLSSLQGETSPKKFRRTIKKATKVIISGLKRKQVKKSAAKKKAKEVVGTA